VFSLSDEGNQERYKYEIRSLIDANIVVIKRLQTQCLEDYKLRGTDDVSSDDCIENETVFKFMKYQ
jgi:hypothetical protein